MDTVKIGAFLRELRKEKELTQEQLADVFNVSARTVSRWETGSNMPDISILVEIADYYQLDIREILNGEKNATLPADDGSSLKNVAEYADKEKERLAAKTRIYAIAGIAGMFIFGNLALIVITVIVGVILLFTLVPMLLIGSAG